MVSKVKARTHCRGVVVAITRVVILPPPRRHGQEKWNSTATTTAAVCTDLNSGYTPTITYKSENQEFEDIIKNYISQNVMQQKITSSIHYQLIEEKQ